MRILDLPIIVALLAFIILKSTYKVFPWNELPFKEAIALSALHLFSNVINANKVGDLESVLLFFFLLSMWNFEKLP